MLEGPQNHQLEALCSFPEYWVSTCNVLGTALAGKTVVKHKYTHKHEVTIVPNALKQKYRDIGENIRESVTYLG